MVVMLYLEIIHLPRRIITLPGVLDILGLDQNLMLVSEMGNPCVQSRFDKDACDMVQEVMVLTRGFKKRTR